MTFRGRCSPQSLGKSHAFYLGACVSGLGLSGPYMYIYIYIHIYIYIECVYICVYIYIEYMTLYVCTNIDTWRERERESYMTFYQNTLHHPTMTQERHTVRNISSRGSSRRIRVCQQLNRAIPVGGASKAPASPSRSGEPAQSLRRAFSGA